MVTARGYLLEKGRFRTFAAPGGPVTQVFGLNNRGQIAGYVAADEQLNDAHGFLLAEGVDGPFTPDRHVRRAAYDRARHQRSSQVVGGYERSGAVGVAERTAMRSWSRLAELVRAGRPD